jgi:hypothetical protein
LNHQPTAFGDGGNHQVRERHNNTMPQLQLHILSKADSPPSAATLYSARSFGMMPQNNIVGTNTGKNNSSSSSSENNNNHCYGSTTR